MSKFIEIDGFEVDIEKPGALIDLLTMRMTEKIKTMSREDLLGRIKEKNVGKYKDDPDFNAWLDSLTTEFLKNYYLEVLNQIAGAFRRDREVHTHES